MDEWFTVTQTAEKTDIPPDTVRRYVRNHRTYLKTRKRSNSYQIHRDSLRIVHEIRRLYDTGMSVKDVDEQLGNIHPMTIELVNEQKKTRQTVDVALALHEMKTGFMQVIEAQQKELRTAREELAAARQEINELTKDVNEVKNRKWSTLSIDDVRKVMNEEKKSWWSKLFKK
ncbi:hypothetical protein [Streptomyces atratus]|uniref:hypothetical protein n=1 Tax=Streptomyces atratus TaxID=1893 RepID=UPI003655C0B8